MYTRYKCRFELMDHAHLYLLKHPLLPSYSLQVWSEKKLHLSSEALFVSTILYIDLSFICGHIGYRCHFIYISNLYSQDLRLTRVFLFITTTRLVWELFHQLSDLSLHYCGHSNVPTFVLTNYYFIFIFIKFKILLFHKSIWEL